MRRVDHARQVFDHGVGPTQPGEHGQGIGCDALDPILGGATMAGMPRNNMLEATLVR